MSTTSKSNGKYQLFDDLRPEEYSALEADILARGVLVPVEEDQDGNILDGHNRKAIAEKHGLKFPKIVRDFATEKEKQEHVIKVNLARRHLDPLRWGQAFAKLLEVKGVNRGSGARNDKTATCATVAQVAKELGVSERTAKDRLAKSDAYVSLPPKLKKRVDAGELTISQAKLHVKKEERRKALSQKAKEAEFMAEAPKWTLIHQDVFDGLQSVIDNHQKPRLIFADPPYNIGIDYGKGVVDDLLPAKQYAKWFKQWINICFDILADDGSLWVMISDEFAAHYYLAITQVGFTIRSWIKWYETFGTNCANAFNRTSRHIFYAVKNPKSFVFHHDPVTRPSDRQLKYNDKRAVEGGKLWDDVWGINPPLPRLNQTCKERIPDFPTQLPIALVQAIVECASDPGDLVVDPFNGSGTTGVACIRSKRMYVGIDNSKQFIDLATLRLKGEKP